MHTRYKERKTEHYKMYLNEFKYLCVAWIKEREKRGDLKVENKRCEDKYVIIFKCPTLARAVKWVVVGLDAIKLCLSADIIQMNGSNPIQSYDNHSTA